MINTNENLRKKKELKPKEEEHEGIEKKGKKGAAIRGVGLRDGAFFGPHTRAISFDVLIFILQTSTENGFHNVIFPGAFLPCNSLFLSSFFPYLSPSLFSPFPTFVYFSFCSLNLFNLLLHSFRICLSPHLSPLCSLHFPFVPFIFIFFFFLRFALLVSLLLSSSLSFVLFSFLPLSPLFSYLFPSFSCLLF